MVICTFIVNACVQAALLLLGTYLIEQDELTVEILLAFMLYQGQLQVNCVPSSKLFLRAIQSLIRIICCIF